MQEHREFVRTVQSYVVDGEFRHNRRNSTRSLAVIMQVQKLNSYNPYLVAVLILWRLCLVIGCVVVRGCGVIRRLVVDLLVLVGLVLVDFVLGHVFGLFVRRCGSLLFEIVLGGNVLG